MAIIYPKITGNKDTSGAPTDAENHFAGATAAESYSKLDLFTRGRLYDNLDITNINTGFFSQIYTHTTDGHTEAYLFIIVKNTVPVSDAATNLRLQQISLHQHSSSVGEPLGDVVWSTDGTTLTHETSFPIECDYKKKNSSGDDILTPASDENRGAPFIGIQNESDGSDNIATKVKDSTSDTALDNITTANFFAKFKVSNSGGSAVIELVDSTATDHHFKLPIFDAHKLCQQINGGIPNGSYASFMLRVNVDDVTAFDVENYTLNIKHDGQTVEGNSADIRIPIQLSMENLMQCEVRIDDTLIATNDQTGTYGTDLQGLINTAPSSSTPPSAQEFYGAGTTNSAPSTDVNFDTEQEANDYISDTGTAVADFDAKRTIFQGTNNQIIWSEVSAIKEDKHLTVNISDNGSLTTAANMSQGTSGELNRTFFSKTSNSYPISLKQSPAGSASSSIAPLSNGGYPNFSYTDDKKTLTATFLTEGTGDPETKTTVAVINYIKYPKFTIPVITQNLICASNFSTGKVHGVNSNDWSTSNIDTSTILHTDSTNDNYTFPVLHNHLQNTSQHFVRGHISNYNATSSITNYTNLAPKSVVDINVRINSTSGRTDTLYNGITTHDANTGVKRGAGFANFGCVVEQATYASGPESTSNLSGYNSGSTSNGDGANDKITNDISGLSDKFKDYSVKLETTNARDTVNLDALYNYEANQIRGLGAERYLISISLPTGIIDFGEGKVPNHFQHNEIVNFAFAQYPSLPDLNTFVYEGFTAQANLDFDNLVDPSATNRWQKLTVLPNTLTNATASTRVTSSDGLYDWAKDTSSGNTNKGTFKMPSNKNATVTDGSNTIDVITWRIVELTAAVTADDDTFTISTSEAADIQEGMRIIEQHGSASEDTTNTTEFQSKNYIVTSINTSSGVCTVKRDLGYNSDGTSNTADGDLPAISNGKFLLLVDDFIQPGMMIEHDNLKDLNKGYYIDSMAYVGGSNDGDAYNITTANTARNAGATDVRLTIKHKDDNTAGNADGSDSTKKIKIFKPYVDFSGVDAGVNLFYEIKNQPLSRAKQGEKIRVVAGTGDSVFVSATDQTSAPSVGQIASVTASTSSAISSSKVDIIVDAPNEFGVTKVDGSALLAKKDVGNSINAQCAYQQYKSTHLGLYEFNATDIADGKYFKEFTFQFVNKGCEDLYLHSAEFIDPSSIAYTKGDNSINIAKQPSAATNVLWQVSLYSVSSFANSINLGNSGTDNISRPPSLIETDRRVSKDGNVTNVYNSIGCKFSVSSGGGITGSYFKYLKIGYVRDTGRTKYYKSGATIIERPFSDKEIFYAHIPVVVHIDATSEIRIEDADGTQLSNGQQISIEGLIA